SHLLRKGQAGVSRVFREIWLFFWRDLLIASTYRTVFLLELVEALFGAAMFYYVARFVDSPQLERLVPEAGGYFAFSLVGFIFLDYLNIALDTFDRSLQEARDTGTLEHLLVTQTSLPVLVAGSAIYPFLATTIRVAVYIAWGVALFGFPLHGANWPGVLAMLVATLLAFCGLGIFSASYVLLFKRGNPAKWFLLGISSLTGGTLFPVSILPDWLQIVARANPVTYALDGMRTALLGNAPFSALYHPLGILVAFAAILLPCSVWSFGWALRRTKMNGTLTHS
ncbi:MAG TPA: ABC transporter permease, partial [Candidatus Dormibacteraeota bacterium]|nr:ABC transporter permease [Candidatus Dormibacteraeota bacterium]